MTGISKALDALQAGVGASAALLGSGPHDDWLLVTRDYDARSGSSRSAMLRVRSVKIKPGMENEFRVSWNRYIRPVYENLAADGSLLAWELDGEWVVKEPGRIYTVIIANGAEGGQIRCRHQRDA